MALIRILVPVCYLPGDTYVPVPVMNRNYQRNVHSGNVRKKLVNFSYRIDTSRTKAENGLQYSQQINVIYKEASCTELSSSGQICSTGREHSGTGVTGYRYRTGKF
jgi:hypothetical protein